MNLINDIREVFKVMRRRKPSKLYCPRCGSPEIRFSPRTDYWLAPRKYLCHNCGYHGPVVMELEKEEV